MSHQLMERAISHPSAEAHKMSYIYVDLDDAAGMPRLYEG